MWHLEKWLRWSYLQGRTRLGQIKILRLTYIHTTMCEQRASRQLLSSVLHDALGGGEGGEGRGRPTREGTRVYPG